MSLPHHKPSPQKSRKAKSVQSKKVSFGKQKYQISIDNIIQNTLKCANQKIMGQLNSNRESQMDEKSKINEMSQPELIVQKQGVSKNEAYLWQKIKIQEKRKIKGIKSKLSWRNYKQNSSIVIRAVLTDNFTRNNQPDYFIQLDSATIELLLQEQRLIQSHINKVVQQQQMKIQQKKTQKTQIFYWLEVVLISCHNFFVTNKFHQRKKSKDAIQFSRVLVNTNYILYPNPASISWSPHGMLCLSENKTGNITKPILGNVYSYKDIIEAPYKFERFTRKNNQNEDLKMIDEGNQQQQTTQAEFYGWDAKQQVNFSIFGKDQQIMEEPRQTNLIESTNQKIQKRASKDHQIHFLGNISNIPPKLQKIYRRFFLHHAQSNTSNMIQKLKIFVVKNQNTELQDGILYLIDKIQKNNRVGVTEALIENQFTGYHGVFNKYQKQNQKFDRLKYQLIIQFLQQKIRITPQSQQFLYMKSVLIENQYFRLALENYFQDSFRRLKITDMKYQRLGTYDNFDEFAAQKLLFKLIQECLNVQKQSKDKSSKIKQKYKRKPEKYQDPNYKQKKYQKMAEENEEMRLLLKGYVKKSNKYLPELQEVESGYRKISAEGEQMMKYKKQRQKERQLICWNVNLNLMPFLVVNKFQFVPLQFNMILTPNQRKTFLQTIIPILWIKDRSIEKFQYKIAKRVIIANSKILNFLQKISNIAVLWKRNQSARRLKTLVKQYRKYQENVQAPIGKVYVAKCQCCQNQFTAYSIEQLLRVTRCPACKYL